MMNALVAKPLAPFDGTLVASDLCAPINEPLSTKAFKSVSRLEMKTRISSPPSGKQREQLFSY